MTTKWVASGAQIGDAHGNGIWNTSSATQAAGITDTLNTLEAELAEAKAMLKELEWAGTEIQEYGDAKSDCCPKCKGIDPDDPYTKDMQRLVRPKNSLPTGHAPDCRLDRLINTEAQP